MNKIRHLQFEKPRRPEAPADEIFVELDEGGSIFGNYLVPIGEGRDPALERLEGEHDGAYAPAGRYQLRRYGKLVLDLSLEEARELAATFKRRREFLPTLTRQGLLR